MGFYAPAIREAGGANYSAYRPNFYFLIYRRAHRFAARGLIYQPEKKVFRRGIGRCGRAANYTQYCPAWLYDTTFRHIGPKPAIAALLLYALLPIIRNTFTGITGVDATVKEAAIAMGMSKWQVLSKVELPLAMPVIFAGIRTATVINVGVATLASYIAAGGLGEFIFGGISLNNTNMILAGAIPAAVLAILFDFLLSRLQKLNVKKLKTATATLPLLLIVLSSFYIIPSAYGTKLKAGFTPEFMGRRDGNLGLQSKYRLKISTVVISDAVMYKAAYEKQLDVISGYSTDGRLKAYDLVVLKDDKGIFPPYYAAPIIRENSLKKILHGLRKKY